MLDDLLRSQDGVITLAQARTIGLSAQTVMRRARSGRWRRCGPGVYFANDRQFTDAARIRSAVWSYGSRATASGLAAAWWLGATRYAPQIVEVTVPRTGNGRRRPGARRLLHAASDGARSEAERLLVKLLKGAGVTGWQTNYPVSGYRVDVAFPDAKVAIEVDGWAFHSDAETFVKDRRRQNVIALLGWQVLRFTWLDLTEHPDRVLAEIKLACR